MVCYRPLLYRAFGASFYAICFFRCGPRTWVAWMFLPSEVSIGNKETDSQMGVYSCTT